MIAEVDIICNAMMKVYCTVQGDCVVLCYVTVLFPYIHRLKRVSPAVINIRGKPSVHINLQYLILTQTRSSIGKRR